MAEPETTAVKPRVVFDCNVYLQAAVRDTGPAFACLELAESKAVILLASPDILAEVASVLSRPNIRQKFTNLTDERVSAYMERLIHIVELVTDVQAVFSFSRDPKDEPYINLAIVGQAICLVSRDNDLLSLRDGMDEDSRTFRNKYPKIEALDPVEFLRMVRAKDRL